MPLPCYEHVSHVEAPASCRSFFQPMPLPCYEHVSHVESDLLEEHVEALAVLVKRELEHLERAGLFVVPSHP
jgi:hypothetical protein